MITLKITLFRLPFTYKLYYEEKKEFKREKKIMDILTSLEEYYKKKTKKKSRNNNQITGTNSSFPIQFYCTIKKTQIIKNLLDKIRADKNFRLEKDPKEKTVKFSSFADEELKEKVEIDKIEVNSLTTLIAFVKDGNTSQLFYLPENKIIDDYLQDDAEIFIYETFNSNGIKYLKE